MWGGGGAQKFAGSSNCLTLMNLMRTDHQWQHSDAIVQRAQHWQRLLQRRVWLAQAMRLGAWWRATLPTMAAAGLPTDFGCRVRAPAGSLHYLSPEPARHVSVLLPIPERKALKSSIALKVLGHAPTEVGRCQRVWVQCSGLPNPSFR